MKIIQINEFTRSQVRSGKAVQKQCFVEAELANRLP